MSWEENPVRRLRAALEGLGPIFSLFVLYMSTRVDLLAARDCLELASLPDLAEESSPFAVLNLIGQELGCPPEDVFRDFQVKPFISGLLDQQHHAWLADGQAVTVKLVHPEAEELLYYDVRLLHLLTGAFISDDCSSSQIESAIDDFGLSLQQRTDFAVQAAAVARLSKDMEVFGMLGVPFVHKQLTTSRMLTIERLPGQSMEEILTQANAKGNITESVEAEDRYGLAHRLCVAWLRQALLGSLFPAEPSPSNITILPSNQIAFTDGVFAGLPSDAKANLWDYLVAVLTENPDQACSYLLKEMEEGRRTVSENELRQRFRQLVPFRDGEWAYSSDNNSLAEHFFLHWKLMSRGGYRPRVHLPSFYRGLFMIASVAQRLAPQRDALRDALQNVRILAGAERLRDMLSTPRLGEQMDSYFGIMMDLPQRLDEALTLGAKGDVRLKLRAATEEIGERRRNSLAVLVALFMVLASCAVLSRYLAASGLSGARVDSIRAVAFLMLGAIVLRVATR